MNIAIHYNPALDTEDAALALARRLFAEFDEAIDSLTLVPTTDTDDFTLSLDGHLIHSTNQSGRRPRVADLRAALA